MYLGEKLPFFSRLTFSTQLYSYITAAKTAPFAQTAVTISKMSEGIKPH